jgi:hypothetical protein
MQGKEPPVPHKDTQTKTRADALRANLMKRKQQMRTRKESLTPTEKEEE